MTVGGRRSLLAAAVSRTRYGGLDWARNPLIHGLERQAFPGGQLSQRAVIEGSATYSHGVDVGRALAMRDEWVDDISRQLGVPRDVVLGNPPRIESTRFDSTTGILHVTASATMWPPVETTSIHVDVDLADE
jgi:hypothetical protein